MKKKLLSMLLVAVMILSTFAIIPVTAEEATNTFNASDANPKISTTADIVALQNIVNAGTDDFSGQTITLENDVTLPTDWVGIGVPGSTYFKGTFNGKGHTITMSGHSPKSEKGGLFGQLGDGAVVTNFKMNGTYNLTVGNYQYSAAVANWAGGTVTISNVVCSVNFVDSSTGTNGLTKAAGILCSINKGSAANITIDNCVYDGTMIFNNPTKAMDIGGFIGRTYHTGGSNCNITISNCMFAGKMKFSSEKVEDVGVILGCTENNAQTTVNVKNFISAGSMEFSSACNPKNGDFGALIGWKHANPKVNLENVYYQNIVNPCDGGNLPAVAKNSNPANKETNVVTKTADEMLTLTAATLGFSADATFSFKDNEGEVKYYPCPTGVAPTDGTWVKGLTVGLVEPDLVIRNYEDMKAFASKVNDDKDSFVGKLVVLENDITLESDWIAIGKFNLSSVFSGTFDGQGHTITANNVVMKEDGGAVFNMVVGGTICNLTLDGRAVVDTSAGYRGGLIGTVSGDTLIQNVRVSLYLDMVGYNATLIGGFVGSMRKEAGCVLTFDQCLFDGKMNFSNQATMCGGFLGSTHNDPNGKKVIIKDSVYAGHMMFNDNGYTEFNGCFIGCVKLSATAELINCVSIGIMTFDNTNDKVFAANRNSVAVGVYELDTSPITITNFYYVPFGNGAGGTAEVVSSVTRGSYNSGAYNTHSNPYGVATNVQAMSLADIAKLDATAFTADCNLSLRPTDFDTYYPCPASMVGANGEWIPSLVVNNTNGAKVLGAQIRCTGESDLYSGIRFVGQFKADAVSNAGTADANFGLILINKEFYDAADDKNTIAGLLAAGGVDVQATQVEDSIEGYYRVNAVVYEITAEHYTDEIVAIAYINGELVGSATTRSIYQVATKCVADTNATAAQKTFCNGIINSVEG